MIAFTRAAIGGTGIAEFGTRAIANVSPTGALAGSVLEPPLAWRSNLILAVWDIGRLSHAN